jgi:hypothetical protein
MIYLIWLLLVPFELIFTLVAVLLSPILPIFATEQTGPLNNNTSVGVGPRLPSWLYWFQTWDNSLNGDDTFEKNNPPSYLSKIKWLIRNPLPCFAEKILTSNAYTISGNNDVTDGNPGVAGHVFVKASGLFQFVWVKPIGFNRCIYINIGWNIRALTRGATVPYHATYSFSPRISSFG